MAITNIQKENISKKYKYEYPEKEKVLIDRWNKNLEIYWKQFPVKKYVKELDKKIEDSKKELDWQEEIKTEPKKQRTNIESIEPIIPVLNTGIKNTQRKERIRLPDLFRLQTILNEYDELQYLHIKDLCETFGRSERVFYKWQELLPTKDKFIINGSINIVNFKKYLIKRIELTNGN
jgi:hypothetical protein